MAYRHRKTPHFRPHRDKRKLDELFPYVRQMQELAAAHGISDIFQDNGGKYLQLALVTGLKLLRSREGNDAADETGREYELKTLNIERVKSFTTHHHLNPTIIAKYRSVDWIFAVYRNIELDTVYFVPARDLEPFFDKWEKQWHKSRTDINNPKIPLAFVADCGQKIFPAKR